MDIQVILDLSYIPSPDVVARDIEGEFIIVPIASRIGDADDKIYALNETGRVIWEKLNGQKSLQEIARLLEAEYEACTSGEIEKDILSFVGELLKRKIVSPT